MHVATTRFESNMLLICLHGPRRNIVLASATMLPREYRIANMTTLNSVSSDCARTRHKVISAARRPCTAAAAARGRAN